MPKSGFVTWEAFNAHKDKDWRTVHHIWPNIRGVTVAPRLKGSVGAHTHVMGDIVDTPWAWANVLKTGSNLTDLATRQHAGLTDILADQHHPQSHTLASHSTKAHSELTDVTHSQHHNKLHSMTGDQHSASGLTVGWVLRATDAAAFAWGFLTKLGTVSAGVWQGTPIANAYVAGIDQNLLQASSPTHVTAKLTALTDGYIPYHVSDALGLANSPIFTDGTNVAIGTDAPVGQMDLLSAAPNLLLRHSSLPFVTHYGVTDVVGSFILKHGSQGGLSILGQTYTGATQRIPLTLVGASGSTSLTQPAVVIEGYKHDGADGLTALTGAEDVLQVCAGTTPLITVQAAGYVGIKKVPTCELDVNGIIKGDTFHLQAGVTPNLAWLSDVVLGTLEEGETLSYDQGTEKWIDAWGVEYDNPRLVWKMYSDFFGSSSAINPPWDGTTISGGTAEVGTGEANHPGILRFYSLGGTANSGHSLLTHYTPIIIAGREHSEFVFKTPASLSNVYGRFGFQNSKIVTLPTNGIYINMVGTTLTGKTRKVNAESTTGTSYALSVNTWYRAKISVNDDVDLVTFSLYEMVVGEQVVRWTNTLATNIPTGALGHGVVMYSSGTDEVVLTYLDMMVASQAGYITR